MGAPCGKADSCEHCPYPDCTWDGLDGEEYRASYERDADARHANQDKRAAQQRAYREANREKIADRQRAWYEANREKIADQKRAYYEANREKINAYMRDYRRKKKGTAL